MFEKETKKAGNAYEELDKKIKDQEKSLEEAKKEYAAIVLEQGKSSKAAQELAGDIEKLSKELEDDKKAFDDAGKAADALAGDLDDTGKNAKEAGDSADKASGGFTVLKGVLADLAATAIKACIDGLKDLAGAAADAWKNFDEGRDTIIKLTGATGELADSLLTSYGNVSRSVLADSQDIGEAIGEVNTRFGLTGDALDKISEKYLKFADITGSDVIGSIDDTQKALSAYGEGIDSIDGFLDALAATSQKTGVETNTLSSGIIQNATAFQEMGLSLEQATLEMLGRCDKVTVSKDNTTIVNGAGNKEAIADRVAQIKAQIAATKSDYDKEKLQERLGKLAGGVAVLYVGAASEVEMKEKKDRVEDALNATRAAVEEGIIPGGGVAFIRAIDCLKEVKADNDDEQTGINIIAKAIEAPLRMIVENAGVEGSVVVNKVREGKDDFGYNARADRYENLFAAGVVDPTKVTRVALENAASVAGMFLTTECVLADKKEETPAMPAMNPGMGGMM